MSPSKSELPPAIHNITFCGLTGAIFVLLTFALVLYIEGFVTNSWTIYGENFTGLWQTCTYIQRTSPAEGWFITSQVLISIGFFGVAVSFVLATIYMTANRTSKNVTLASLAFITFVTVVFIVIGVTVLGIRKQEAAQLSWSFAVTVVAAILTLLAGILTILQIRRSNVRLF